MKGFGAGGLQGLMKQANQMQAKIKKIQEDMATQPFEGTAGGGAVTITANGGNEIVAVKISNDLFTSGDLEMVQDLVKIAANEALKTAKTKVNEEMEKVTGKMGMPGLF